MTCGEAEPTALGIGRGKTRADPIGSMAAAVTVEAMKAYIATLDVDLTFLWSQSEVPLEVQYALGQASFNTLRKFSTYEDDRAKVRAALAADFGLDVAAAAPAGPRARVALAATVSAWEIAKEQVAREVQLRAESKTLNLKRPISSTERMAMKKAIEALHGRRAPHELPSNDYLSLKTEEVEAGEPQASQLDEITNAEEHEDFNLSAMVDVSGGLKIVKKRAKSTPPTGPEGFRSKLRIECYTWMMLSLKHANVWYLVGLERETWLTYVEYFMGKKVMMMEIPTSADFKQKVSIPWQILLNYEFACRKLAFRLVKEEGQTLNEALLNSIKDAECKEVHFTSPIALSGSKRLFVDNAKQGTEQWKDEPEPPAKKGRGANAGRGKGGGRGKGRGRGRNAGTGGTGGPVGRKQYLSYTPDGRQICFSFNKDRGCQDPNCERVHICQMPGCGGAHPVTKCPKKKKAVKNREEDTAQASEE